MIRRDVPLTCNDGPRWILISQIDHAHLAARLAECWGAGGFLPLVPRDRLLWAIEHHDDGWHDWDRRPGVSASGKPTAFTEMDVADSVAIWTESIEHAASAGNLQGYVVAGHFCALMARNPAVRCFDDAHSDNCGIQFIERFEACMARWLRAWQAESPERNTLEAARGSLAQLQFFDRLSLRFCCSPIAEPELQMAPGGQELKLTPWGEHRLAPSPWPFTVPSLDLEILGRAVPVASYTNREELAVEPAQPVRLHWHLEPGPPAKLAAV